MKPNTQSKRILKAGLRQITKYLCLSMILIFGLVSIIATGGGGGGGTGGGGSATIHRVIDYGAKCDGVTDDTAAIQKAIDAAQDGDSVEFPAGSCCYSTVLLLNGKNDFTLFGAGKDSSFLIAVDPLESAVEVIDGKDVTIRNIAIDSPNSSFRSSEPSAIGFYILRGENIILREVKVKRVSNAGILLETVFTAVVRDSEVIETWSDGIHVTGGSSNVIVGDNYTYETGDDSFASIGYGSEINQNIEILDNESYFSNASGVAVEGGEFVTVQDNIIYRSGVAGIRVGSELFWLTGEANEVTVSNNTLYEVKQRGDVGHPAILIYSNYDEVKNVYVHTNYIENPKTWAAFQIVDYTSLPSVHDCEVVNNTVVDDFDQITDCIAIDPPTLKITIAGNTLNGGPCE